MSLVPMHVGHREGGGEVRYRGGGEMRYRGGEVQEGRWGGEVQGGRWGGEVQGRGIHCTHMYMYSYHFTQSVHDADGCGCSPISII